MSAPEERQCYIVNKKPTAEITDSTFKLVTKSIDKPNGAEALVKVLYLSNDPAQRTWIQEGMDPERAYMPLPDEGDIMPARGLCEVVEAGSSSKFQKGDLVLGSVGWTQYATLKDEQLQKAIQIPNQSPTISLGALGSTGLTAYYGFLKVGKATSDDQCVVVSGAAGATGSMVVQIAKQVLGIKKVIGIASTQKCDFVKSLGADECIDYKSSSWKEDLKAATGSKADIYFDNVGGEMLDTMLPLVKRYGRVVACGSISGYNDMNSGTVLKNYFEVISNRLTISGFIVVDALPKAREYIGELAGWISEGKIKVAEGSETIKSTKFEGIPEVWQLLFSGGNSGKLVTKLD